MSASLRLSIFYGAVFFVVGVQTPFWPVWLASRGLEAQEIAIVLAAPVWLRIAANPIAGALADRGGRTRVMRALALATLLGFALFLVPGGFWLYLALSLVTGTAFAALLPLGDSLALATAYAQGGDYGRMRLWGSLAFIAASLIGGRLLAGASPDVILQLLLGALALVVVSTALLPRNPARAGAALAAPLVLLRNPRYLLLILAASLVQASHAVYYGFGTLHWRELGYSAEIIGFLWAEGVIVEIVLFAMSRRVLARISPEGLLVLAGIAGVVRWTVTGFAATLPVLAAVQLLHAFTFGAAHLGAMHVLARTVPPALAASGQSLYSALGSGVVYGIAMLGAGALYAELGGLAYLAMATMSGIGIVAALGLVVGSRARTAAPCAVSIDC